VIGDRDQPEGRSHGCDLSANAQGLDALRRAPSLGWRGRTLAAKLEAQQTKCVRRPAGTEHGHGGQEARSAPIRGGLLFGYFLLATQEKVTRAKREILLSSRSEDAPAGCSRVIFVAAEQAPLYGIKSGSIATHVAPTEAPPPIRIHRGLFRAHRVHRMRCCCRDRDR
jgi:hypothetical protein